MTQYRWREPGSDRWYEEWPPPIEAFDGGLILVDIQRPDPATSEPTDEIKALRSVVRRLMPAAFSWPIRPEAKAEMMTDFLAAFSPTEADAIRAALIREQKNGQ